MRNIERINERMIRLENLERYNIEIEKDLDARFIRRKIYSTNLRGEAKVLKKEIKYENKK